MTADGRGLSSFRVVQLAHDPGSGYCARLLASLGAEVLLIEPPGGAGYRLTPAFATDPVDVESSPLHLFLDGGKASIVVDPGSPADRATLAHLLADSDVALCGRDAPAIRAGHPDLVVASLTPLGLSGPDVDAPTSTIGIQARSGWMYQVGIPGEEPLQLPGELPSACISGTWEAIGVLAALRWRSEGGTGQLVEVSELEALAAATRYFETTYVQQGELIGRNGATLYPYYGYVEASDGYTAPCAVTERHVRLLGRLMALDGEPSEAAIREWLAGRPKVDSFHLGQGAGIPWGYLATVPEVLDLPPLVERRAFVEVVGPNGAALRVPSTYGHVALAGAGIRQAPRLGGDQPTARRRTPPDHPGKPLAPPPPAPLAGIRVIDLTSWWAGPMANLVLATLGAEVIKVESVQRPDAWRTLLTDSEYGTVDGRRARADELDAQLLAFCVGLDRAALVAACRSAGVRADPVQTPRDVLADPHLLARGFHCQLDHPVVGRLPYSGLGVRLHATPLRSERAAPLLGEHNSAVLSGLLGLSGDELTELAAAQVIGTRPLW